LTVRDYKAKKTIGIFDENGSLEVTDESYIEKMKRRFEVPEEDGACQAGAKKAAAKPCIKSGAATRSAKTPAKAGERA